MRSKKFRERDVTARSLNKANSTSFRVPPDFRPASSAAGIASESYRSEREIDFAKLPDGSLVELVQGKNGAVQPQFLIWGGKQGKFARCFTRGKITYLPTRLEPIVARAMRFPPGVADYGSTRKLFEDISAPIARVTLLPNNAVALLASFIFATWLPDFLPVAPVLWIIAPPMVPREPLLRLLGLLCRRTLLINELTTAALHSLPMQLRPTVITEPTTISRAFLRALRASNRRGSYEAARGKLRDLFCAKIVFAPEPLGDSTMAGLPLEIALVPTRERVPRMEAAEVERAAAEFQSKLLMYRLVNWDKVPARGIDLSELATPLQELAHNLAMSIVGDPGLQSEIVPLLKPRDREIRVDRTLLLESIVLEALLAACHDGSVRGTLSMADLM